MFNIHDRSRNAFMLEGHFAERGYDWWWHSFTAIRDRDGEEKQFFIEYFLCNPALGGNEPIFGQLPENKEKGVCPSYLMVKAGCWGEDHCQLHRYIGWNHVEVQKGEPYMINAFDCYADDDRLRGSVAVSEEECGAHPEWMSDSGSMSWSLVLDKQVAFNVGFGASAPLREAEAFEMYWHAEGMKTAFSGTVTLNGELYKVIPERSYGYADKNWGRDFTSPWVWLSSNNMRSRLSGEVLENSVFDIGGGRPKIYFAALDRKLLGAFWYEGTEYEYNFSKLWTHPKTRFECKETEDEIHWHVIQENRDSLMETRVKCQKKEMLLVNYEAPDGSKHHNRLWNGGNGIGRIQLYKKCGEDVLELIDDIDVSHIGCEYGEYCDIVETDI